ncbi:hypothetical protein I5F74_33200, partial [Pseudomonas aeruginosa]|nr:hypothetical protein [Pseudomonas aeruginosa]
ADGLHPAVLQLIDMTVRAAHAEGKWVGVCGELAGPPQAVARRGGRRGPGGRLPATDHGYRRRAGRYGRPWWTSR